MISIFLFSSCAKDSPLAIANDTGDPKVEIESRTVNCENEYCNNQNIVPTYVSTTINYNGCPVAVTYFFKKCVYNGASVYTIYDMNFTFGNNAACHALLPITFAGTFSATNASINSIYRDISIAIEKDVLSQFYDFGTGWAVEYIESSCLSYCVKREVDFEGTPYLSFGSVKCGESCCKRYTSYTKNGWGATQVGQPTIIGDPICSNVTGFQCTATGGTSLGICNVACDRL